MTPFSLKVVTPDGEKYNGQAEELVVRTISGDMGIMAGHINIVAPLGTGECMVVVSGEKHYGACIGGMVSVMNGAVTLVPTTFEWAEDIDVARAKLAEQRAQKVLKDKSATQMDVRVAQARLRRALVRQSVASHKPA